MSTAEILFEQAFNVPRDPRSDAYKAGVLDALRYCAGEIESLKSAMLYEMGTAEADAWFAGVIEGKLIWRDAQLEGAA